MTNVSEWSTSAGSNNSAPPDGAPENMLPGKVNDCMREIMAAAARWYKDQNGSLVTAGTTTAYTVTTNSSYATLSDVPPLVVRVHAANTGATTLAVDGLVAKTLVKNGGVALVSGDLSANQLVVAAYNPNLDRFEIIGPFSTTAAAVLATLLTVDGAGSLLDADLLDGLNSTAFAQVANNLSDVTAATAFTNIKQAASDTVTGVLEIANQTEMETGSDVTRAVTPGRQHYHPGMAKAWGVVQVTAPATVSLLAGYNCSVAAPGFGQLTVTLTTPCSSANYVVVATATETASATQNHVLFVVTASKTASTFTFRYEDSGGGNEEPEEYQFVVYGDQ